MRIAAVETILLSIPFDDGGTGEGLTPTRWDRLEIALVRVDTDAGLTGWGEGFGYFVTAATKAVVDRLIAPLLVGAELGDPAASCDLVQRRLALFGRHGITMFAISGVDIALWDLAAQAQGVPLAELLGGVRRCELPGYASLVRYGEPALAARMAEAAAAEGWGALKLHEIEMPAIEACRAAVPEADLIVDVNCAWTHQETRERLPRLAGMRCLWLEEPVFPPEDAEGLATLAGTVPLAAGENLCTAHGFAPHLAAGSMTYPQPSVTKVGGVTEFRRVSAAASECGLTLMPHSPYFGPGWHATLHLAAADPAIGLIEQLWIQPEALPDPETPLGRSGRVVLPEGPGLGFRPDPAVLERYGGL